MRFCIHWLLRFTALIFVLHSVDSIAQPKRSDDWLPESVLEVSTASPSSFTPFLPDTGNSDIGPNLFTMSAPSTFRFQNEKGQFLKMPVWLRTKTTTKNNGSPGSIFSFQFRNFLSSCLLLYLDDGGPRDYIELAIRDRILELRFKFGKARSVKISIGNNLDDRRWHTVSLEIRGTTAILTLDGRKVVGSAAGPDASPITPKSFCFLGGIPKVYRLQELSLPSVYFDSGFRGSIRRYAIDGRYQRPLEKSGVTEEVGSDLCYSGLNPCKNNGSCYVRNNEPTCDCSATRFSGKYCEGPYEEATATFLGGQWFEYDVSEDTISSFSDTITLYFKTKQSNGLMLHTGKSADFVNLSIKNGGISLVVNLGSGAFEVLLKPTVGSFNDNKWHFLKVERELNQGKDNGGDEGASVNLTVDDAHNHAGFRQNDFTELTLDNVFYVGGSPSMINLPGSSETNNFIGCLKEVTYKNTEKTLQLSRMAKNNDPNIQKRGEVKFQCSDIDNYGPVSFRTPQSFLQLDPWKNPRSEGMKLDFITTEPHGLLLYACGDATRDYIAIELYDGVLYLLINLGSGPIKKRLGYSQSRKMNDGKWHHISLRREVKLLTITVDNESNEMKLMGTNSELNVKYLYLGGVDFRAMSTNPNLPKGLWTAALKYGFVGCMRDVYMDGSVVDIYSLAKSQYIDYSSIAPNCPNPTRTECDSSPCKNGGKCLEGWKRYICDCSETSYGGSTCELVAQTVGFNGSQSLQFQMATTQRTQTENISFRFKTPLSSGLLLTTTSKTTADRLTVKLVKEGQVKLTVDLDCFRKNCTAPRQGPATFFGGSGLNDNKWHTVKIERKSRSLSLEVDGKLVGGRDPLPAGHTELQFDVIHLGKATGPMLEKIKSDLEPSFAGLVQNLMFNSDSLIDDCLREKTSCQFTGTWGESKIISNAITFQSKDSYISTSTLKAYSSMTLFFNLRTTTSDGLILYNAGIDGDFIAVELVNGFVHYVYNLGNGPQIMSTPDQKPINDNKWHEIRIARDVSNTHTLSVDGIKVILQGNNVKRNLDLEGYLYIGGVSKTMYYSGLPDRVASRRGFQGCLGTFDFNGVSPQLLGKDRIQSAGDITRGCTGPTQSCSVNSCMNGGKCQQEWNSFTCDCSLTSYIGPRCQKHISTTSGGTSYRFNGGMIMYKWPSPSYPSSRSDSLAFGFATKERNCMLTKISGLAGGSTKDFMQLEIENSRLTLRFNIGSKTIVLVEPMSVADGQYHHVTVCRKWMNATLRVDSWPLRTYGQAGRKNTVFNSQSKIQIGGIMVNDSTRSKRALNVVHSFKGQMTGFIFNGVRVFTLADKKDRRVTIYGDVKLINDPPPISPTPAGNPLPTTMATMTTFRTSSSSPGPRDGSECDGEDICSGTSDAGVTPRAEMHPPSTKNNIASSSTKNVLPKMMTSVIVESIYNVSNISKSANPLSNGDVIFPIKPDSEVKTGFLGGILNGTTAMIVGIVGAAVVCIVIILAAIYKYKHKDENSFHAGKKMKNGRTGNGNVNGHAGSIVRKKNDSIPMNNRSIRGKDVDKEYYV